MKKAVEAIALIIALIIIVVIPIYFGQPWLFSISWIPALFIWAMITSADVQNIEGKSHKWKPNNHRPHNPNKFKTVVTDVKLGTLGQNRPNTPNRTAPLAYTLDANIAQKPSIKDVCIFWNKEDSGSVIGVLEKCDENSVEGLPYYNGSNGIWYQRCAPIYEIRYRK